jgi:hypothetical protein
MSTITLARPTNAPGVSYALISSDWRAHPGDILVQTDWDYPGIASSFGWSPAMVREDSRDPADGPKCDHPGTDGTITCPDCGTYAATFIDSAAEWLDDHIGATADDPGYFAGD